MVGKGARGGLEGKVGGGGAEAMATAGIVLACKGIWATGVAATGVDTEVFAREALFLCLLEEVDFVVGVPAHCLGSRYAASRNKCNRMSENE